MTPQQVRWLVEAVNELLDSCGPIDYYTYHDAPSRPIHDEDAEARLRLIMEEVTGKSRDQWGSVTPSTMKWVRNTLDAWKERRR